MKKMKKKPFTFVDDIPVGVAVAEARSPSDEYETNSEDDFSDREN